MNLLKNKSQTSNGVRKLISELAIRLYDYKILKYLKEGKNLFYGDRKTLLSYQKRKLENLLIHAYNHTQYYRRVFDEIQLIKNNKVDWTKFSNIPILTKDNIRKHFKELLSDDRHRRKPYINTSGGSTGEPVKFVQDKEYFRRNVADKLLFAELNNKKIGDLEIKLWGSERDILEGSVGFKEKLINLLYNRIFLNSFSMSQENMMDYINVINAKKPVQIWAYADSIYELARFIIKNKLDVHQPLNIICTAGTLYNSIRETIQKAFPASKVLNQYGSREVGIIGVEVEENKGIRIFDHSIYLEILDKQRNVFVNDGVGNIIVTNLNNYSMPLIRFDIGDIGEKVQHLDEQYGSFSTLLSLKGRRNCHFIKENGDLIHGEYFTHLFYNKEWVKNFQVVQLDYNKIEFRVVVDERIGVNRAELDKMIYDTKIVMGENCEIIFKKVDKIPRLRSGKYQFVYSEVQNV